MTTHVVNEVHPKPQRKTIQSHPAALSEYRSRTSLSKSGEAFVGHCPFPDHSDSDPSFNIFLDSDGETWLHKCWGCNRTGNIIQFITEIDDVTVEEARETFQEAIDEYDPKGDIENKVRFKKLEQQDKEKEILPLSVYTVHEQHLQNSPDGKAYLETRGILPETAKRFHLGFRTSPKEAYGKPDIADKGWLAIPYIYGDTVKLLKYRSIVAKRASEGTLRRANMETCLFNAETVDATDMATVYVVSGEIDAITLEQAGFRAISLSSDSITLTPEMKRTIQNGWQIVLAGDNDSHVRTNKDSGERKMQELWDEFPGSLRLTWPSGMKDANQTFVEYCKKDIAAFQMLVTKLTTEARKKPIDAPLTDSGNAERFTDDHRTKVRYCHGLGTYLVWDGKRWARDENNHVMLLAIDTARSIQKQALEFDNRDEREKLGKFGFQSESLPRLNAMLHIAQSKVPVTIHELDANPMLLNVLNGTIDLQTGELHPHRQGDLITKVAPVKYDPDAKCPVFEKYLEKVFNGDRELIGFVQRALGYSLTGTTKEEVFFLLHGTGRNGKSKLLEVMKHLMGDYAKTTDFETFIASQRNGAPRNDIARLMGARFVTASESEDGGRLAESLLKQMTGGDTVAARFLNQEFFEFVPQYKIWLSTNHLLVVRGTDDAIWERIKRIPFTVYIPPAERDKNLSKKLEREASGILSWTLEGLRQYRQIGLGEPPVVTEATKQYRDNQDVLGKFIADTCLQDKAKSVQSSRLFERYKRWADDNGEYRMNQRKFSQKLEEKGFIKEERNNGNFWLGLALLASY